MVAGAVAEADDVDVGFDQAGDNGAASEVEDAHATTCPRSSTAHGEEASVADRRGGGDGSRSVLRVDARVCEDQRFFRRQALRERGSSPCGGGDKLTASSSWH